jgi:hypothetical protein
MIRIPCRACGGIIEVPQELAGSEFQCPHCKLLSDIPTLSELKQISEDGTYVLNDSKPAEDPYRLAEMIHVWGKGNIDDEGEDIDMRGPTAAEDQLYHVANEATVKPPPRYDPGTGELVRPLDVKPDPKRLPVDPASIPMAQPALGYADQTTTPTIGTHSAFVGLGRPINIVVILVVFVLHVFIALVLMGCSWLGYFIGIPFMFIFLMMLIAHWGNVVDDIGRQDRDEIPRPFRDLQWYEDLWQPFCAMALSLMICYGPELILRHFLHTPRMQLLLVPLWLAQSFFFPAIFLITTTSGTLENLRPDRIWGTVVNSGGAYAIAVALWTIAGTAYSACLVLMIALMEWAAKQFPTLPAPYVYIVRWEVLLPALMVTIYLMHFFCWHLGLIYREHHARFPWAFQYHKRKDESFASARRKSRQPKIPKKRVTVAIEPPMPVSPAAAPMQAPTPAQAPQKGNQWPQIQ